MKNKSILANLDLLLSCVALAILVVVTFGGVFMRYWMNRPLMWAEEVQMWCFLWMSFLGAGAAFRYGSHVAVEMVVERMSPQAQRYVKMFDYVVIMLVLGYLGYLGCDMIALMVKIGKTTNMLHIPFYFINGIVPFSCVLMMISCTVATFGKNAGKNESGKAAGDESAAAKRGGADGEV